LQAVPDARWDVYALGAIFYCLLTGAPPCRDPELVRQLETAKDLPERLSRYRRRLLEGPPPEAHRQVKRIDRSLIQILDKCLAVKPDERFANVQELLDALDARSAARARRPLVTLGFVGPLLLLLVMALFGWRGYHRALIETEELAQGRAIESNRFAAQLAAEKVASEIASYFDIVRGEAERGELFEQFLPLLENPWLRRLSDPQMMDDQVEDVRRSFVEDEQRFALTHYLEARLRVFLDAPPTARATPKFVSMFVLDSHGTMLAAAYDEDIVSNSVGRNWGHRSYFHGGPDELTPVMRPPIEAKPIEHTHLSPVFKSTTTGRLKVAVSTPIFHEVDDKQVCIGVLVMTINHGDFEFFRSSSARTPDRFAVLVDGRPGPERGTILVHPLLTDLLSSSGQVPDELRHSRVPPEVLDEELSKDTTRPYVDPLSQDPRGADYARRWIAAATPVELLTGENG
ncbi:MAG TPA: hypothetical protein PLV92_24335, partial [Pirellulaceae bacterium]|nr:hypothetical protein [Pirellulaceae bacterium]